MKFIGRLWICLPLVAGLLSAAEPLALGPGVHLLIDEHFIERGEGIERKVIMPERFLTEPTVTGRLEHQNWQPFLTVLHDPTRAKIPFRMWYNVDVVDDPGDGEFAGITGLLESADGIHWPGPYERLPSLTFDGRVRFGAKVIDDGPSFQPAAERYKILYFDAGAQVGPRVAFSPDGLTWKLHAGGKPVMKANNGDDIWSAGYDPLRKRYYAFGKTYEPNTWTNADGNKVTATIRRYHLSFSPDFKTWSEPKIVFSPDEKDAGITQWYGPDGFLVRGDLLLGFLRVLRDDLSPAGAPPEAIAANTKGQAGLGASGLGAAGGSGMGYTVLTWSRDGETWHRDREEAKFFAPNPQVGAWDHAMAWIGSAVPVGDEVYLYYAGYRWGHKYRHSVDRQLGLIKARRDRFVARQADARGGKLVTPVIRWSGQSLALNTDAAKGEVLAQMTNDQGEPLPGYRFEDCQAVSVDSLAAPVTWAKRITDLRGRDVRLEFKLQNAKLFALEVR